MKKYISVVALLAAGTAFANADLVELVTIDLAANTKGDGMVATLSDTSVVDYLYPTLNFSSGDPLTGIKAPTASGYTGYLQLGSDNTFLLNDDTKTWKLGFSFANMGTETLTISSLSLDVAAFSMGGGLQGSERKATISVLPLYGTAPLSTKNVILSQGKHETVEFTLSDGLEIPPQEGSGFYITISKNGGSQYVPGIDNLKLYTTAVPEPSAFGLLAGIGALALVASRRRRK